MGKFLTKVEIGVSTLYRLNIILFKPYIGSTLYRFNLILVQPSQFPQTGSTPHSLQAGCNKESELKKAAGENSDPKTSSILIASTMSIHSFHSYPNRGGSHIMPANFREVSLAGLFGLRVRSLLPIKYYNIASIMSIINIIIIIS